MFVPNFKILSQVVSEKSLTEKKFTDRQTNKHPYEKGKNYIPPKYFVYRGYNKRKKSVVVFFTILTVVFKSGNGNNLQSFIEVYKTVGVWGVIANKMEASQETCFFFLAKYNPGLPPDYPMVCT